MIYINFATMIIFSIHLKIFSFNINEFIEMKFEIEEKNETVYEKY